MTAMTEATLPEGGEWATGSLLDKSNVGKYVHTGSGNYARVARIEKVGRTNVHLSGYGRTYPYRVNSDDPGGAYGEFNTSVETAEHLAARTERHALLRVLRAADTQGWRRVPVEKLRRIVAILDEDVTP